MDNLIDEYLLAVDPKSAGPQEQTHNQPRSSPSIDMSFLKACLEGTSSHQSTSSLSNYDHQLDVPELANSGFLSAASSVLQPAELIDEATAAPPRRALAWYLWDAPHMPEAHAGDKEER